MFISEIIPIFATMFEKEIKEYERIRKEYQQKIALLKEVNRLVTEHTISYRASDAIAGEYTTEDMAAGDTVFGDHEASGKGPS